MKRLLFILVLVTSSYAQSYLGASTSTATIPPPAIAPFSGLTGSGTIVFDPEPVSGGNNSGAFHLPIERVTDANTRSNQSMVADFSGSGDRNHWSKTSKHFYLSSSGGAHFFYDFNANTITPTLKYSTISGITDLTNGGNFSRVFEDPFYAMASAASSADGPVLKTWNMGSSSPPTGVTIYDFSATCIPNTFIHPTDPPAVSSTDGTFANGFSTSASQGTGRYIAAYTPGVGCSAYNTSTGVITGDYGTTGPVVCQNCTGGATNPGTFSIHNVGIVGEQYIIVIIQTCDGTCYNGASPYIWQRGTTNVWAWCGPSLTQCGGHHIDSGVTELINNYNNGFWAGRPVTSLTTPTSVPASQCSGIITPFDGHGGWYNNKGSDQEPFFWTSTTIASNPSYTFCDVNEILGIYPPTNIAKSGIILRFGHTYSLPTQSFDGENAIGSISQDGRWYLFTSPMNNTLGSTSGGSSCTALTNCRSDTFILALDWQQPPAPAIGMFARILLSRIVYYV
jgi:hypothetical protein